MVSKTSATHAVRAELRWPPHSPTVRVHQGPPHLLLPVVGLGFQDSFVYLFFTLETKEKRLKKQSPFAWLSGLTFHSTLVNPSEC